MTGTRSFGPKSSRPTGAAPAFAGPEPAPSALPLRIGLLGLGTVGCGVVEVLETNRAAISRKLGRGLVVRKALVRDLAKPRSVKAASPARPVGIASSAHPVNRSAIVLTTDPAGVTQDPDIDVVVEVMGGIEPARTYILDALRAGKDVVTANKDLIALQGRELLEVATAAGRDLLFEASVAGGIPIVATLKQALAGNRISQLVGIINGTTNYILTAMAKRGCDYADALGEAKNLGYAEADPSADVEGLDAARKLAILASIAFGSPVTVDDVFVEGISRVSRTDLGYAREFDSTVKLLAVAKEDDGRIEVRVHPAFLPNSHPLSAVDGVFNAIYVVGDAVGETMFYGRGAGALPSGSAVVADLMQVARNRGATANGRLNCTCYRRLEVKPAAEFRCAYYLRLLVRDEVRVLAGLAGVFAEAGVSFASIIQRPKPRDEAEIVFVTHPCLEGQLQEAVKVLRGHSKVREVASIIRLEGAHRT